MMILSDRRCSIGEGPIWNDFDHMLYQVNGYGPKEIRCIDLETKEMVVRKLDFSVSAIGFSKEGKILVSCNDGVFVLNDDNSRTPLYNKSLYQIKNANDSKVGPDGRFYVGTQSSKRLGEAELIDGKLYSIDMNGNVKVLLDGLILSNGFDWSIDEERFYHTDSDTEVIKEYRFNKNSGTITFTGRQVEVPGVDGFTIDERDFLYVACWGKGHIAIVNTSNMKIEDYIDVPAEIPASCCFAGKNMDQFVVVTATLGADLNTDKNAGYTFVDNVRTKGRKPYLFG